MLNTRAVLYDKTGELSLRTMELRPLKPGEARVRIRACGLCTGELMDWYMQRKAPLVPGHELVGEIVEIGEGVQGFEIGDRVVVHHHAPCHQCESCKRGAYVHCSVWRSTALVPGGLSDYAIVASEIVRSDLLKISPSTPDEAAVFTEPLACVVKSLKRANLRMGDRVTIVGLGVMGLLHGMLAVRWGASQVIGIDRVESRLQKAETLGLIPLQASSSTDEMPLSDIVIVGPGSVDALNEAWRWVAPAGTLLLFTPAPPEVVYPLDWHTLYMRETRIIPSYSAGPDDMRCALSLIEDGLPVQSLVSHTLPLEQAAEGYAMMRRAEALKVVIKP